MVDEDYSGKAGRLNNQRSCSRTLDDCDEAEAGSRKLPIVRRKRKLKHAPSDSPILAERPAKAGEVPRETEESSQSPRVSDFVPPVRCSRPGSTSPSQKEGEIVFEEGVPILHFDAISGTIRYLKKDNREPEYFLECSYCGAHVQFDTDRCPICGQRFDEGDTGIVSLVADADFDPECSAEMDCPSCGEHVILVKGRCPACMEIVHDIAESNSKVEPVIRADNVIFIHLDVESGELNYLQRLADRSGFEQLTVQLEDDSYSGSENGRRAGRG